MRRGRGQSDAQEGPRGGAPTQGYSARDGGPHPLPDKPAALGARVEARQPWLPSELSTEGTVMARARSPHHGGPT